MAPLADTTVLVSGASGYIGAHVVKTLLDRGYSVRGTVRSTSNKSKIAYLQVRLVHEVFLYPRTNGRVLYSRVAQKLHQRIIVAQPATHAASPHCILSNTCAIRRRGG